MKTILIDDNQSELTHLNELCSKIAFLSVENTFTSAQDAFRWLEQNTVDLIISDVEMPGINGIEMVQQLSNKPLVIFVSAHPNYAVDSFSVQPLHYLVKPLKMEHLLLAVHRAKDRFMQQETSTDYIFVLHNKEYHKVYLNDLHCIEAAENFVQLHLLENKLLVLSNLTQFTKQLPRSQFIRIHKSWSVNLHSIEKYTSEHVVINHKIIPIGNAYKNDALTLLKKLSVHRKA